MLKSYFLFTKCVHEVHIKTSSTILIVTPLHLFLWKILYSNDLAIVYRVIKRKFKMGNTAPGRDRRHHSSGESDSAPTMTVDKHGNGGSVGDGFEFQARKHRDSAPEPIRYRPQSTGTSNTKENKLPTVFKWDGGGKEVFISGSFDNWQRKLPMVKSHGDFYTIIDLPEGNHEYKFMVDGQWVCDQHEPMVRNDMGTENNRVDVKRSDFEIFEALAVDSADTGQLGFTGSPPGEYNQIIPPRAHGRPHQGPPVLPPHLLQVILNKETPAHCEPTLLPEPNHVMLNHLYALSIKDGVMVLSATHRYRKKYVTTLLYKPI